MTGHYNKVMNALMHLTMGRMGLPVGEGLLSGVPFPCLRQLPVPQQLPGPSRPSSPPFADPCMGKMSQHKGLQMIAGATVLEVQLGNVIVMALGL